MQIMDALDSINSSSHKTCGHKNLIQQYGREFFPCLDKHFILFQTAQIVDLCVYIPVSDFSNLAFLNVQHLELNIHILQALTQYMPDQYFMFTKWFFRQSDTLSPLVLHPACQIPNTEKSFLN